MVPTICWSRNCLVWKHSLFHLCCQHINRNIGTSTVLSCNRTYWGKCCQQLFEGTCKRTLSRNDHLLTRAYEESRPFLERPWRHRSTWISCSPYLLDQVQNRVMRTVQLFVQKCTSQCFDPLQQHPDVVGCHAQDHIIHTVYCCASAADHCRQPPMYLMSRTKTPFLPWSFRSWNHVVCHTNIHHDDRSSPLQVLNQHTVTVLN